MSHVPAEARPEADAAPRFSRTLGRSLQASVEIVVSPGDALGALRRTTAWVPLLLIALLRTAWTFVAFSPSHAPVKVLLNLLLQLMFCSVWYLIVTLAIAAVLHLRGGRFQFGELLRPVVYVGVLYEFVRFGLAVAGRAAGASELTPTDQYFSNLGWMIPSTESLPLHHVLSMLDILVAYCAYRLMQGLEEVVEGMSRAQLARSLVACSLVYALITTTIKIFVS